MADSDHHDHEDDAPTMPSKPGMGSSDALRRAFDRAADTGGQVDSDPERIGPYRVIGRVGRGGMGSVYKATDEREISAKRLVAVKLIRKGLDTEDVLRRFQLEGQLLAALNHPNIARLYEVAQTDDGQPYFVMEYIDGKPLDAYCDEKRLAISGRLEIFRKVCAAVHHAHENLIVHRDLKPGNILVTPEGEPKLLDFGIAKLLNPALGRVEVMTAPTMRIMTPEYASPEQVSGASVGTRSDVYSLGVLLYELLSGRRPYQFAKRIEAEVVRVICESVPVRPSTAVTSEDPPKPSTATSSTIAQSRSAERVESLRRSLSGDLDDIVMMAMEKSAERRYASADHFSNDIERYLGGLPVVARKTGSRTVYQIKKFVRRHRTEVAAAALLIATVLGTGTVTAIQWRNTSIANANAAAAMEERLRAEQELSVASAYGDALWSRAHTELTFAMTPAEREAFWTGVREDFDTLSARFDANSTQVRRAKARALLQAGSVMGGIRSGNTGEFAEALTAYEQARDELGQLHEAQPEDITLWSEAVESQLRVADVLRRMNRPTEAIAAYEEAVQLADATRFPDEGLRESRQRSKPRMALGQTLIHVGDAARAASLYAEEEATRRERLAANPDSLTAKRDLAIVLLNSGELAHTMGDDLNAQAKLDESLSLRKELLAQRPSHTSLRRDVAIGLISLSIFHADLGRATTALDLMDEAQASLAELAAQAPDDARLPLSAATGLIEYAAASERAGDADAAREGLRAASPHIDALATVSAQHPALPTLRSRRRLIDAQLALAAGDLQTASAEFELARDQLSVIVSLDPGNTLMQLWLGDSLAGLGESRRLMAMENGDPQLRLAADAAFEEARRAYARCKAPAEAFGPESRWWALVEAEAPQP